MARGLIIDDRLSNPLLGAGSSTKLLLEDKQ